MKENNNIEKVNSVEIVKEITALSADKYRITIINRTNNKAKTEVINCLAIENCNLHKELKELNNKNYDIYITPLSEQYYYFVVDDIKTDEALEELKKEFGEPRLHLETSENNHQFIYRVDKKDASPEIANLFVRAMNKKYGDPNFSGAEHAFRLAGFRNKKEGRNNFLVKIIEQHIDFSKLTKVFDFKEILKTNEYIKNYINNPTATIKSVNNNIQMNNINKINRTSEEYVEISKFFNNSKKRWEGLAKKQGWCLDDSVIDFNAIKETLKKYADYMGVCGAVLDDNRREHTEDYTIRTLEKALAKNEQEQKQKSDKTLANKAHKKTI